MYEVGERVLIRSDIVVNEAYGGCYFTSALEKYKGTFITIVESSNVFGKERYKLDLAHIYISPEMILGSVTELEQRYFKERGGSGEKSKTGRYCLYYNPCVECMFYKEDCMNLTPDQLETILLNYYKGENMFTKKDLENGYWKVKRREGTFAVYCEGESEIGKLDLCCYTVD